MSAFAYGRIAIRLSSNALPHTRREAHKPREQQSVLSSLLSSGRPPPEPKKEKTWTTG